MIKRFICMATLAVMIVPSARAFSLAGPVGNGGDNWQLQNIGYGAPTVTFDVAPKNLGEGYRRNISTLYYAYSAAFLDYFGSPGITNVDAAFGILNNALTNGVSSYSSDLSEVPLDSQQINYTAQGLELYDIKSLILTTMMPQLGLTTPEANTWKIHDRGLPPGGTCPIDEYYLIVQRNYFFLPTDYDQFQYSSYVNNTLYSFYIEETCAPGPVLADTIVFPVDPDPLQSNPYTAVAGLSEAGLQSIDRFTYGGYYTGLTRDDIAGLRYLYNTNNVNTETVQAGSLLFDQSTNKAAGEIQFPANPNSPTGFGTFSLASLLSFATTNSPAAVLAAFPGVVISSSFSYFVIASNATVTAYFKPAGIGYPAGTAPILTLVTNYTPYLATNYLTTFANIVAVATNQYTTNYIQTVTIGLKAGYPYGSPLVTNTSLVPVVTKNPSGDFYVAPTAGTNVCGSGIVYLGLSSLISTTNVVTSIYTNLVTTTNTTPYTVVQSVISKYLSHTYVSYPVVCTQDVAATGLFQGINKIQFVRANYDSLLGQFFQPFTNGFSLVAVTNSTMHVEHFDRPVFFPDIVLDAADLAVGNGAYPLGSPVAAFASTNFDQTDILPGLAGPGTIYPGAAIVLNTAENALNNGSLAAYPGNAFLNQLTQFQLLVYGSFDGTTNEPVVYPNGASVISLQNELFVQVSPASLANGALNVSYPSVQFSATGGSFLAPFTWASSGLSSTGVPNSGLPPGMSLSSSGLLSGTPTQSGTYDFTVTLTDSQASTVVWNYTLIIQ